MNFGKSSSGQPSLQSQFGLTTPKTSEIWAHKHIQVNKKKKALTEYFKWPSSTFMSAGFIRIKNKVHTTFDFLQKKIYLNSFLVCSCNLWKKKRKIMRDIHKPGPAPDNSCQNKFFVGGGSISIIISRSKVVWKSHQINTTPPQYCFWAGNGQTMGARFNSVQFHAEMSTSTAKNENRFDIWLKFHYPRKRNHS